VTPAARSKKHHGCASEQRERRRPAKR